MEHNNFQDIAYLENWFYENFDCLIAPYIQQNFYAESWNYQFNFMKKHLFFTKKIIEDHQKDNLEKQQNFLDQLSYGKSKIAVIEGARGGGKTATACWIGDELYLRGLHKKIYFVKSGEKPKGFPDYFIVVPEIEDVPPGSLAIVDESAIKYNSRNSWKDENKDFISRLVVLRHKDISVILITQHLKMIDIGIRRLADIKIYKKGANLTHEDEGPDDERHLVRARLRPNQTNEVLIEIPGNNSFFKFIHDLTEWWGDHISKSFANFNPEEQTRKIKGERLAHAKEMKKLEFEQKREIELAKIEKMKELGINPNSKPAGSIVNKKLVEQKKAPKNLMEELLL